MASQPKAVGNSVPVVVAREEAGRETRPGVKIAAIAWLVAVVYYFLQYVLRSAPSVMMPQLSTAFGINMSAWHRLRVFFITAIRRSASSRGQAWTG